MEADVLIDAEVPTDQERLLEEALAGLGVTARTRVVPTRRGVAELSWLVLVSLPLQAFLANVGSRLADDAYQALRAVVRRLAHRDRSTPGDQRPMVLRDVASGLRWCWTRIFPTAPTASWSPWTFPSSNSTRCPTTTIGAAGALN